MTLAPPIVRNSESPALARLSFDGLLFLFFDLHQGMRCHLHHDALAFREDPP
jgi:hypothetical protein